jgi:hypothetical protein
MFQDHTSGHAVAVSSRDVNKCLSKHNSSNTTRSRNVIKDCMSDVLENGFFFLRITPNN